MAGPQENQGHGHSSPEPTETARPRRRQKRAHVEDPGDIPTSRKSKTCSICRRLKVKCDLAERGTTGGCSRCQRIGLRCLSEKRSWTAAADGDEWQSQVVISKLERALEDVLEKLNMPPLDLYVHPVIIGPQYPPRSTRGNSEEGMDNDGDVSPGPMNSLIEATQLNGLRSQLRSVKQRKTGGMRRMISDLISEKIIALEEAEEMLELFKSKLSHHLFSASIQPDATLESIRTSSTVLFTAIITVTALHIPGKEILHDMCHSRLLGLVSAAIFDRFHTLDDIRGLCIAAFWQPDLSWKLSGICIRMATELDLHHAFYETFYAPDISDEARKECLEKVRLWYLLYILDHQSSITYGRPAVMAELRPMKDHETLLDSPWCTSADRALTAQVTLFAILSRAFDLFGLEPKRTMAGDDESVLNHMRFTGDAQGWRDRWMKLSELDSSASDYLSRDVELHHHFSNLVLNSLVLRGRPLHSIHELPIILRPLALKAIHAAHSILQQFVNDPRYRDDIVGTPLYMHSMMAFAVVFLMKLCRQWHAIGITIDPMQQTIPLVEAIIQLLRGCKAGANHMVFSMANGFERMLRKLTKNHPVDLLQPSREGTQLDVDKGHPGPAMVGNDPQYAEGMQTHTTYNLNAQNFGPNGHSNSNVTNDCSVAAASQTSYSNWGFQDQELWTMGMGYDLLAPGGHGLAGSDFPLQMYEDCASTM